LTLTATESRTFSNTSQFLQFARLIAVKRLRNLSSDRLQLLRLEIETPIELASSYIKSMERLHLAERHFAVN